MVHITKGQILANNTGMVVCDSTGYYEDGDTVLCAMAYAPEEPVCRFEAKYISFGDVVYNVTDSEKLMEEVKKIDPETLFGIDGEKLNFNKRATDLVNEEEPVDDPKPKDPEPETPPADPEPDPTPVEPEPDPEPETPPTEPEPPVDETPSDGGEVLGDQNNNPTEGGGDVNPPPDDSNPPPIIEGALGLLSGKRKKRIA